MPVTRLDSALCPKIKIILCGDVPWMKSCCVVSAATSINKGKKCFAVYLNKSCQTNVVQYKHDIYLRCIVE